MPEGHSIYRYAAQQVALIAGQKVQADSPQGRFSRGADRINGRRLVDIDTHGKHLFYRFERTETLHVHLGLYGKFRVFTGTAPQPTPATRLTLRANGVTVYLAGPTTCELILPSREESIRSRLGPDPLKAGTAGNRPDDLLSNLERRTVPIGAAIIDQSVIAGLGNIYRAEVLFLAGIHPAIPANEVASEKIREVWGHSVRLLRKGVKDGKITTVPRRGARQNTHERVFVYQRDRYPCRRCGGAISTGESANRTIWWCEACQPRSGPDPLS